MIKEELGLHEKLVDAIYAALLELKPGKIWMGMGYRFSIEDRHIRGIATKLQEEFEIHE